MARYTGPNNKQARRVGFSILENGKDLKRPYGPGQHGKDRKRKPSNYSVQLTEKQTHVYEPGTIVTWLQWSSSKIGKTPAPYFDKRNTWFYIYSFNSREISQFSVYSEEKEAL